MATEIERKFLVKGDAWRGLAEGVLYRQGYLNSTKERTVRIRTMGNEAVLTVKGPSDGLTRSEYEYPIPFEDCKAMLDALAEQPIIEKKRYKIPVAGFVWEVDEFFGANDGLIVAEIELPSEDAVFPKPDWVGEEVSGDPRYFNSSLIAHPFALWGRGSSTPATPAKAEFRVFGDNVIEALRPRMWEAQAQLWRVRPMPEEIYILSAKTHDANVKIRAGLLDVKLKLSETPEGYHVCRRHAKLAFPVCRADLADVFARLGVDVALTEEAYDMASFMAIVKAQPDLTILRVEKVRYGFSVNHVICEYARVNAGGRMIETASVESEDPEAVTEVRRILGLDELPNVGYLTALKNLIGMTLPD